MNKNTLKELKSALEAKKHNLEEELSSFAKKQDDNVDGNWESEYPSTPEGGLEEEADEVEEYSNRILVEYSLETQLKDVDEALERIEKGDYGKCSNCETEINEKRLEAYPEAKTCSNCNKNSA